ncbi:MAG: molybdate ABC transporter permease subunit [Rhodobacteraceae bacterium]|nr:molybdate ABC transporter permease subunit [Paracoccaceae bacterium]
MFASLQPNEIEALLLTLKVSVVALVCALPLAISVAYVLSRFRFPGHGMLNAAIHLPLMLPPVVTGYLLLLLLGPSGPLGRFLLENFQFTPAFNWKGAALAAGIMAFPLIVRPIRLAFDAVDPKLEQASASLGCHGVFTFLIVSLPLALPGVLGGAILGFAKAMGEFGATITFVSNIPGETRTLSLALYTAVQSPDGDALGLRLMIISICLAIFALLLSELLVRRLRARLEGADV